MEAPPTTSSSPTAGLTRRPGKSVPPPPSATGRPVIHVDIDPPPRPSWWMPYVAVAALLFLVGLQFLPATHFRHPADPYRTWIPIDRSRSNTISTRGGIDDLANDVSKVHIYTWTDCLDLRVLAVLFNSTLSGSRAPENVFFQIFIPEGADEESSFHKMKVVLPESKLKFIRQNVIKEKLNVATPEGNFLWSFHENLTPFVVANAHIATARALFISSEAIIKGNIEDLYSIDLGSHGIAAAEDCSKHLGDYVNMEVLNSIQKAAAKSWVSDTPYDESTCIPDLSLLLIKPHKLEKTLVESIMWWRKVINIKGESDDQIRVALALALFKKYQIIPSSWKLGPAGKVSGEEANALPYDGPKLICSEDGLHQGSESGDSWKQYLTTKSSAILE